MVGEDFLGLRELGIASELGISNLSVPKKLLRPKGTRMGAGNSLPYVKSSFSFSSVVHLPATFVSPAEPSQRSLHRPTHHHLHLSHSSRREWKTESSDYYDHSTSPVSMLWRSLKPPLPSPRLPRMVPSRSEAHQQCKLHQPSQGSCYNHPSPFQLCHSRLGNRLHSPGHQQYSSFQTTYQVLLKQRWDLLGKLPAGNRRTHPRRNRRRRKIPPHLEPVVAPAAFLAS